MFLKILLAVNFCLFSFNLFKSPVNFLKQEKAKIGFLQVKFSLFFFKISNSGGILN